jgi:hypothetical protein
MFPTENITSPSNRASILYGMNDKPRLVGDLLFTDMKRLDVIGIQFGSILPISFSHIKKHAYYDCVCLVCGAESKKSATGIKNHAARNIDRGCDCTCPHGMEDTAEYRAWSSIKIRCAKKNSGKYPIYGGRGIKVCDRWLKSFRNFYADMGPRPSDKHSIDRIDNNGNYEPSNCRWATRRVQSNNRRDTRYVDFCGEKTALAIVSEKLGIPYRTLYSRIFNQNWTVEKALSTPYVERPSKNRNNKKEGDK